MHVHLVNFQVLDKTELDTGQPIPLEPWETPPGRTPCASRGFEGARDHGLQGLPGKFPFHCHILDHEDHEMMRQFQSTNNPATVRGRTASAIPVKIASAVPPTALR